MNKDASTQAHTSTQSVIDGGRQLAELAGHLSPEDASAAMADFLSALNPIVVPVAIRAEE
ncbi:MAG: hypothetical protein F2840_18230 [Actinobacteria bacterium]|uniref:Unannotated protein n=1 Tax=freshwater metagenome TaxID=449393 RepID=A0A6J7MB65_9ZZZZ|nr:hypothetical protein [Actinomycetota bacterium]